ncbi:MAG TPA: hypothetical protein VLS90_16360 [Thermodesulfobacteriota bacterium]|nr:hypothetical protein [Thermodesulfobacteriota bacterium]
MTVNELIMSWTDEERRNHAELIDECLQREKLLLGIRGRIEAAEKELDQTLDRMVTNLTALAKIVEHNKDQLETTYLHLAAAKGNA